MSVCHELVHQLDRKKSTRGKYGNHFVSVIDSNGYRMVADLVFTSIRVLYRRITESGAWVNLDELRFYITQQIDVTKNRISDVCKECVGIFTEAFICEKM